MNLTVRHWVIRSFCRAEPGGNFLDSKERHAVDIYISVKASIAVALGQDELFNHFIFNYLVRITNYASF